MAIIRKWIRFLFGFSGAETNGFLILLPLLFLILFSAPIYRSFVTHSEVPLSTDRETLERLVAEWKEVDSPANTSKEVRAQSARQFRFNPNTASIATLEELGFEKRLATRIVNFRGKGGKFFVKSDLLKIYGMDSSLFVRLRSFVDLPETVAANKTVKVEPKKSVEKVDLNAADTTQLKTIYGIGSKLARRIVVYREKLGGFIRPEQLHEVYGLDSIVIGRMLEKLYIADLYEPTRVNINGASDRELSAHPYISPGIAKAIVTYRFQHGNFASTEDIRVLRNLKKEEADKIIPYLSVNP